MLKGVNIKERIGILNESAKGAPDTKLNQINKELKLLIALKETGKKPEEVYVIDAVPVIPPSMRPIYSRPGGSVLTSDLNQFYKDHKLVVDKLKDMKDFADEDKTELRKDVYDGLKALYGMGDPISKQRKDKLKGILTTISGTSSPKEGFFQKKVWKKRQSPSARSTIVVGPKLHLDQIGIPEDML